MSTLLPAGPRVVAVLLLRYAPVVFGWLRKVWGSPTDTFLSEMESRVRALPGVTKLARVRGEFALSLERADTTMTLHLDNLFAETRELAPDAQERQIVRFLGVILERTSLLESPWEEARGSLLPVMRGPTGEALIGGPALATARELVPCVRQHLAIDSESSIAFVTDDSLDRWGITWEAALAIAHDNLSLRSQEGIEVYDQSRRIFHLETHDDYESSRLLLPGFLSGFVEKVEGRPIAIVPTRDQVLISGDARSDVVLELCAMAEREFAASSRRISAAIYTSDERGALIPYRRSGIDDVAQRVRHAHVAFEGTEYAAQREALKALHENDGTDIFVANYGALDSKNRGITSWTTWPCGVDSLLPIAEVVGVGGPGTAPLLVEWPDLMRIAGDCLHLEPRMFPLRYRALHGPTEAQLAELSSVASLWR